MMSKKSVLMFPITSLLLMLFLLTNINITAASTVKASNIVGLKGNQIKPLNNEDIQKRYFTSHGNIPTLEGLFTDLDTPHPLVHLIDSTQQKGHLNYAKRAFTLPSQYRFDDFKKDIIHPETRQYLPFTLYNLSASTDKIKWVLQIRRYSFKENDQAFAALSKRLMDEIGRDLFKNKTGALLVYASNNKKRRPNVFNLKEINKLNINSLTELALLEIANADLVSILNGERACGYLKMHQGDLSDAALNTQYNKDDIVIFQHIPERIPPIAGIITLTPQTPLSHINLLAINRGTLNISASSLAQLTGFDAFIKDQQLVRIQANPKTNKINIEKINQQQFQLCQSHVPPALSVPLIDQRLLNPHSLQSTIRRFEKNKHLSVNEIGAKASHYSKFKDWIKPTSNIVRPAFALDFSLYFYVLKKTKTNLLIEDLINNKKHLSKIEINQSLKEIRKQIKKFETDQAFSQLLTQLRVQVTLSMPTATRIRLRSSTNSEDLAQFNGAGLYDSKGFNLNEGNKKLSKKLLKVLASLWLDRAFWEREYYQIQHQQVAMAILINEAFTNETANGVLMINKLTSGQFEIWMNVQSGEHSVSNPEENQIPESFTFKQFSNKKSWSFLTFELIGMSNIKPIFLVNTDFINQKKIRLLSTLADNSLLIYLKMLNDQKVLTNQQTPATPYSADFEFKLMLENGKEQAYIKQARLIKNITNTKDKTH